MGNDFFGATRWLEVKNFTSGPAEAIPAFALVEVTGVDTDGGLKVRKPSADSLAPSALLVNGPQEIPAPSGSTNPAGQATATSPVDALYDTADGTPAAGVAWGSGAGSFKLRKGKTGFRIHGGHLDPPGRVTVERVGGADCQALDPAADGGGWSVGSTLTIQFTTCEGGLPLTRCVQIRFPCPVMFRNVNCGTLALETLTPDDDAASAPAPAADDPPPDELGPAFL